MARDELGHLPINRSGKRQKERRHDSKPEKLNPNAAQTRHVPYDERGFSDLGLAKENESTALLGHSAQESSSGAAEEVQRRGAGNRTSESVRAFC